MYGHLTLTKCNGNVYKKTYRHCDRGLRKCYVKCENKHDWGMLLMDRYS